MDILKMVHDVHDLFCATTDTFPPEEYKMEYKIQPEEYKMEYKIQPEETCSGLQTFAHSLVYNFYFVVGDVCKDAKFRGE